LKTESSTCDQGYSSLFSYCVAHLKYSEAQASVRVNAVRLIKVLPKVKKIIDSGKMNLTVASTLQRFFKDNNTPTREKEKVIKEVIGKSTRETQKILDSKVGKIRKKTLTLNERILKKLDLIQAEFDDCSEIEAIEALLDRHIKNIKAQKPTRIERGSKNQRYISRSAKEDLPRLPLT